MPEYKDFKLVIARNGTDKYSVRVESNDQIGEAVEIFGKEEIISPGTAHQNDLTEKPERKMKITYDAQTASPVIDYNAPLNDANAKIFGINLSKLIFRGEVSVRLGEFKTYCSQQNAALRVRLDLSLAPELAVLPWEYLRKTDNSDFVCLDGNTTLVRYLQTSVPVRPLKVNSSLRILVLTAMPDDAVGLNTTAEIQRIQQAIQGLDSAKNIRVEVLNDATPQILKETLETALLKDDPFHVLHFIGHGRFNDAKKEGELLFDDGNKKSLPYNNDDFARLLQKFNSDLRLVVLNSCEGAQPSAVDSYSSVAAKIMQIAEIPSVIAMQFSITDSAAIIFAKYFYTELANGANLDRAIYQARLGIKEPQEYVKLGKAKSTSEEWATPVLYLRSETSQLFDIKIPRAPQALIDFGHYSDIKHLLSENNLVVFIGLDVNLLNRPIYESWKPGKGLPTAAEICSFLNNTMKVSPPISSLAGLAKKLELKRIKTTALYVPIFESANNPSKLYEILSEITKRAPVPAETDPWKCSLIFVTTTYDCALEKAFQNAGINNYNIFCYSKSILGEGFFRYRQCENGTETLKEEFIAPNNANQYLMKNTYPVILKLPGEVVDRSTFAITEDDFIDFSSKGINALLPSELLAQITISPHLYLGYDLQNWTLRMMWKRLCYNRNTDLNRESYALIFDEREDPNAQFWSEKNINFAAADLDDYVAGLEQEVLPNFP